MRGGRLLEYGQKVIREQAGAVHGSLDVGSMDAIVAPAVSCKRPFQTQNPFPERFPRCWERSNLEIFQPVLAPFAFFGVGDA
jgi:hypothetical protein